eukprot:gnl/MRDRNA2_/MRDRNA2_110098_c0_seq1.p1 gnl/MRDRNA2_/MRDRNA2_110098_c0~~gnl/MRDRNA2_/MRDRNA2_110098_c0_seq1.p1  ORF type:complete len:371 (-),score=36.09 gnl/MRDRNA2_/MRDRNA2_110098_c0_seq1:85-1197(-)
MPTRSLIATAFATCCGWGYLLAWGSCFLPQMWLNYQRKSVIGMSFDVVLYNVVGFTCFFSYNAWRSHLQIKYNLPSTVRHHDLGYAIHALTCTLIIAFQILRYDRGKQHVSWTAICVVGCLLAGIAFQACRAASGQVPWYVLESHASVQALDFSFVQTLGYVKVLINFVKYPSQIMLNFSQRSTAGMAVQTPMLDLLGGSLAFTENAIAGNLTGNLPKMSLSVLCLLYDTVLLAQHFICFGPGRHFASRNYTRVATCDSPVVRNAFACASSVVPELRVRRACPGDIEDSGPASVEDGDTSSSQQERVEDNFVSFVPVSKVTQHASFPPGFIPAGFPSLPPMQPENLRAAFARVIIQGSEYGRELGRSRVK